ncbi:CidA/LrgA family protein [Poseidonocella sp. HB161398]|uniref:CidA/LrgA family protein n=1 Tax=Poseidonocella sp. HB161398 TaxID=2320855 RepID=UPI0011084A88|nr:CidA/LrgA family protein [Poseidonocella sp. HB161398]
MIWPLSILLGCQLAGEAVSRVLGLPVPGPVIGMVLLLVLMAGHRRVPETVAPTAHVILGNLSLLFVPAGVGIVSQLDKVAQYGFGLLAALLGSTVLALAAGVATFRGVARVMGDRR